MTESQDAIQKMAAKLKWLRGEAARQAGMGNVDIAADFEVVAQESSLILKDLELYVERNPDATRATIREILKYLSGSVG